MANANPHVVLTYDIKEQGLHTQLKKLLIDKYKFSDRFAYPEEKNKVRVLPNTTLIKLDSDKVIAQTSFKAACKEVGATWEKIFIAEFAWGNSILENQP